MSFSLAIKDSFTLKAVGFLLCSILKDLVSLERDHSRTAAPQPSSKHLSIILEHKPAILESLQPLNTYRMGKEKSELQKLSLSFGSKIQLSWQ